MGNKSENRYKDIVNIDYLDDSDLHHATLSNKCSDELYK